MVEKRAGKLRLPMSAGPSHIDVEDLTRLVEGGLSQADQRRVREHMAVCRRCRGVVAELVRSDNETAEIGVVLVGRELDGYQIQSMLGRGTFGDVYRAIDPQLMRPVAIKVLKTTVDEDPSLAKRMLDEARAANAIRHPGIVDVQRMGHTADGKPYIVMELLEGQTLEQRMARGDRMSEREALELLEGILVPLEAAHRAGVLHRDLKPSNVFLSTLAGEDRVKLLDFGLAKLGVRPGREATQTRGMAVGTPAYIAPEQAMGDKIGARTDLFSLGVTLYEALTQELPFGGQTMVDRVRNPKPVPPIRGISSALNALVQSLLESDPARRPESADAVLATVRLLQRGVVSDQLAEAPPTEALQPGEGPLGQDPPTTLMTVDDHGARIVVPHDEVTAPDPHPLPGRSQTRVERPRKSSKRRP